MITDINRVLEWQKLRMKQQSQYKKFCRSKSIDHVREVTDDDVKELTACFDLGFGFDKVDDYDDPKLLDAFPALKMYGAIKQGYSSGGMLSWTSMSSDSCSSSSSVATSIVDPSDDPEKVKTKLKHWAQLVRYSILENSSNNKNVAE
ncbi:ribonuclease H-like domain-containing protein [Tanacetum coccineum]